MLDDPRFDTNPQFDTRPERPRDAAAAAYLRKNPGATQPRPDEASVNAAMRIMTLRLSKLKLSRPGSPSGTFVDDLVEELKKEGFEEFVIRWAIHQGRASGFLNVGWLLRADPDANGSVRRREGQYIQSATDTLPCSVDLSGERPVVFGKVMNPLSPKELLVVQLLIKAYPDGLTTAELKDKFGDGDPFATLRELRKKNEVWKRAIIMPERPKQGEKYRLAPDQEEPQETLEPSRQTSG